MFDPDPAAIEGVDHRVHQRRGRADRPRLAAALHAKRVMGAGRGRGMIHHEHRQIVRPRHGVVHIGAGEKLPALRIIDRRLAQRLTDPLGEPAMDLALDDHRVHHVAEVVGGVERADLDDAGVGVHLNLAGVGAGGVGEVRRIIERGLLQPRLDRLQWVVVGDVGRQRHRTEVDVLVGAGDAEHAVLELDVVGRGLHQMRGDALGLGDDLLRRAHHGRAADRQRAGPVGAHAHRGARRVAMDDVDHLFRAAEHLGDDLAEGGLMALAVAVRAGHHHDAAGRVDADRGALEEARPGAELTDEVRRRDAASLDIAVEAKPAELAARRAFRLAGGEAFDVGDLDQLVHRAVIIAGVIGHRDRRLIGELVRPDEVAPADLDRVDPHLPRRLVDDPLQLERGLRPARAAIGVHGNRVGEDRLDVGVDQRRLVIARQKRAMQPGRHRRREGGKIRAHIRQRLAAQRQEPAVRVEPELDLRHMVAAMGVGDEGLRPVRGPLDRHAEFLRREGRQRLFGVMEDLRAEPAAHVRRDDAQLVLGDAEHEGPHQKPDHMRVLRRGVERRFAVRPVIGADRNARLHRVGDQTVVHQLQRSDVMRALDRLVHRLAVLFDKTPVVAEVVRRLVMNRSPPIFGAARDRRLHVDHCGKFGDVELDRLRRVARRRQRGRDHRRDRVAHMAHLALRQNRVARLLHRLAVAAVDLPAAGQAAHLGEVRAGQDPHDARHGRGGGRIDAVQRPVRHGRAQHIHVMLTRHVDVVGVIAGAGQEPDVLAPLRAGANARVFRHD